MNLEKLNLTQKEISQVNDWAGYFSYQITPIFTTFINCDNRIVFLNTGNQFGKNDAIAKSYVMRILGIHPVESKNFRPTDEIRIIRFASVILPMEASGEAGNSGEVGNTQYPAFKKRLPPSLIKKDITIRKPVMTIKDPQGGKDLYIEFTGYSQQEERVAGVQRRSIWLDEEPPKGYYEENVPRILAANGDVVMSLTPTPGQMGWVYDELYDRARIIYRTKAICDFEKKFFNRESKEIEIKDSKVDIAIIRAATDDNPTLKPEVIEELFNIYDDPDVVACRRYGVFKQMSGQIFKGFENMHVIDKNKHFPDDMPHEWLHARAVDYHEHNPWACVLVSISPDDEVFIYDELNASPEKMVSLDIARELVYKSKDYKYSLDLIDALAATKQSNTGLSVIDDLNRYFFEFKKEGIGTGGYWQSWDTKSQRGRDAIRERLKNSRLVGVPFNNKVVKNGTTVNLPTLWITDNCKNTILSFKNWRLEGASSSYLVSHDTKEQPQQKWSHFPMAVEALFKHVGFKARKEHTGFYNNKTTGKYYFRGAA